MRAKREEGKVSRSREPEKRRIADGSAHFRAGAGGLATWWDAARLDGGAGVTAAEPRSARAGRAERVTEGPAVG